MNPLPNSKRLQALFEALELVTLVFLLSGSVTMAPYAVPRPWGPGCVGLKLDMMRQAHCNAGDGDWAEHRGGSQLSSPHVGLGAEEHVSADSSQLLI